MSVAAADHADADVLLHDRGPLLDHVLLEQVHQEIELALRPLPVLARQAIQRELLDAQPGALLGRAAHAGHAAAVPLDPRQALPLRPAAVAVHDDGDVPGPRFERHVQQLRRRRSSMVRPRRLHPRTVGRSWTARSSRQLLRSAKIVCSRSGPTETISTGRPISSLSRAR